MIENPVRKGDFIVVREVRSWSYVHGPSERRERFIIASVASATRDGLVKRAYFGPFDVVLNIMREVRPSEIFTLGPAAQDKARALFNAARDADGGRSEWETTDALKAALS